MRKKQPEGFRFCITTAISAVQGFLQILVNGKIWKKGDISELMLEAQKNRKNSF